jgi:hypothetical protein
MNPTRVIRHLACILAGLAGALLAASGAPGAHHPRGRLPSWQIALIAAGAAVLAAVLAVLADRSLSQDRIRRDPRFAQRPDPPQPGRHPGPDIPSVPPLEVGAAGPHTAHAPAPDRHPVGQSRDRRRHGKKEQQ